MYVAVAFCAGLGVMSLLRPLAASIRAPRFGSASRTQHSMCQSDKARSFSNHNKHITLMLIAHSVLTELSKHFSCSDACERLCGQKPARTCQCFKKVPKRSACHDPSRELITRCFGIQGPFVLAILIELKPGTKQRWLDHWTVLARHVREHEPQVCEMLNAVVESLAHRCENVQSREGSAQLLQWHAHRHAWSAQTLTA